MAVPSTKSELRHAVIEGYDKLARDLRRVPEGRAREKTMPGHAAGTVMSPADLVAYLIGWNELVLAWHEHEAAGLGPVLPAEGFGWNELGELAQKFYLDFADVSWLDLLGRFERAKEAIVVLIDGFTDQELYGAAWYGSYSAGRMIQLNTSSPYANARRRLRAWLREDSVSRL